ncbi:protein of unknown function [Petrocella atlantisensis]|uniref:Uncharacterized protein n=1 Tax=Petrocella atlantisensis TaxID=2173034 RepID=A0A3P7P2C1_9FIRM|nr:protein of unknown function [Petrocella atlantisensis]
MLLSMEMLGLYQKKQLNLSRRNEVLKLISDIRIRNMLVDTFKVVGAKCNIIYVWKKVIKWQEVGVQMPWFLVSIFK